LHILKIFFEGEPKQNGAAGLNGGSGVSGQEGISQGLKPPFLLGSREAKAEALAYLETRR
jgi:hypothetical protein